MFFNVNFNTIHSIWYKYDVLSTEELLFNKNVFDFFFHVFRKRISKNKKTIRINSKRTLIEACAVRVLPLSLFKNTHSTLTTDIRHIHVFWLFFGHFRLFSVIHVCIGEFCCALRLKHPEARKTTNSNWMVLKAYKRHAAFGPLMSASKYRRFVMQRVYSTTKYRAIQRKKDLRKNRRYNWKQHGKSCEHKSRKCKTRKCKQPNC